MITKSFVTARYAETDQMGVIHHSVYAVWYELARTDFIKKVGISYSKMEEMGILLPLSKLTCKYHQATLYEDEITIETRILALTPSRIQFGYTVYKKGVEKPVNTGSTLHGWTDKALKPFNMKKRYPELYETILNAME